MQEEKESQDKVIEKLQEKDRRNTYVLQKTVQQVYRRNGAASFPPLTLNTNVQPSTEGHHLKGMRAQTAKYEHHSYSMREIVKDVVVPTSFTGSEESEGPFNIPSNFDPQTFPLNYHNEIGIQVHVRTLVLDAFACMGCLHELDLSMEFSFYGITPDIVVICRDGRIVFVIEVKAPNRPGTEDDVFTNEKVGGQIWLYLMSMKQAGVENPLGAICTFNGIRIVSLEPLNTHQFDKAKKTRSSGQAKKWKREDVDDLKQGQGSPDPSRQNASKKSKKFDFENAAESFDPTICKGVDVFRARLYGSETVSDNDMLPMLLLALTTAKMETEHHGPVQEIVEVQEGDDLGMRLFAFAQESQLWFARTPTKLNVTAQHPPAATKNFFLLDTIGIGQKGQVRLAVSAQGRPAAVKFYHFKPSRQATFEEREKENSLTLEAIKEERDKEWEKWNTLYPKRGARKITLAGFPCLLIPYGTRIPANNRSASADFVKAELKRFCESGPSGHPGYAYENNDLRWRHVLKDLSGRLFLSDLGSLKSLEAGADVSKVVSCQMQLLMRKQHGTTASSVAASASNQSGRATGPATKRSVTGGESTPAKKRRHK